MIKVKGLDLYEIQAFLFSLFVCEKINWIFKRRLGLANALLWLRRAQPPLL